MKKYVIGMMLATLCYACANADEQGGGEQKEFITDAAPATDSASVGSAISEALKVELADYYSAAVIEEINRFLTHYNNAKTDTDFEAMYHEGKELMQLMYDKLYEPETDYLLKVSADYEYWSPIEILYELQDFNGHLGPLEISCVAECTEIDFLFDLQKMLEKAKQTTGSADDDFLELVIAIEGDYGYAGYPGFKSWFNQTWDYGGSSLIGDETLLDCINMYRKFKEKSNLFTAEMDLIYSDFVDALVYEKTFHYTQETVLGEYEKILQIKKLFKPEDEQKIKEARKAIEIGGDTYQFDCENSDCSFG